MVQIIVAALVILATVFVVAATILQLRAPDALTRANLLGPLVVNAIPLLLLAKLVNDAGDGLTLNDAVRAILAILGVWIVGSVGTYVIGRSIYGVTTEDPKRK